ncbi:MAG TPA: glucokinase [Thermoanaerobaculia bacterium]|nr:glucokinase [Thermoanaerobaculia bacterium]
MRILAGDIGGTKTLLRLLDSSGGRQVVLADRRYQSRDHHGFDSVLRDFLGSRPEPIDSACLAVAGPVQDDRASLTNLLWEIDAAAIGGDFPIARVTIVNDFHAIAASIPLLTETGTLVLNPGTPDPSAPIGVLGAGTGLGEALVVKVGDGWHVLPSEGGHCDFAPIDEIQDRLLAWFRTRHDHVSYERILSGTGLVDLFDFLSGAPPSALAGEDRDERAAEIADLADRDDPTARRALEVFVDVYGAEAGNLALKGLTRGGIYLAGGIAAKNRDWFTDGRFLRAMTAKGRFAPLLAAIPVRIIIAEDAGLQGAAELACVSGSDGTDET